MLALIVWVTVDVVLHISVPNDEACRAESSAPKSLQAGVGGDGEPALVCHVISRLSLIKKSRTGLNILEGICYDTSTCLLGKYCTWHFSVVMIIIIECCRDDVLL